VERAAALLGGARADSCVHGSSGEASSPTGVSRRAPRHGGGGRP
jgi:hypothetical protein